MKINIQITYGEQRIVIGVQVRQGITVFSYRVRDGYCSPYLETGRTNAAVESVQYQSPTLQSLL